MVLLDTDFDGETFNFDEVFFSHQLMETDWAAWFRAEEIGKTVTYQNRAPAYPHVKQ